jgi:hypothetical protein
MARIFPAESLRGFMIFRQQFRADGSFAQSLSPCREAL